MVFHQCFLSMKVDAENPNDKGFSGAEAKSAIKSFIENDELARKNEWIKQSEAILKETDPVEKDGVFLWGPWQVKLTSGGVQLDSDVATLEGKLQPSKKGVTLQVIRIILIDR